MAQNLYSEMSPRVTHMRRDILKPVGLSPNLYAVQGNKRVLREENIEFRISVFSVLSSQFLQKLQDN